MKICDEATIQFLTIIQNTIDRMGSNSSVHKGFASAIAAAILTISLSSSTTSVLILGCAIICCIAVMDTYYLQIERKYRYLYDQVRTKKREADFSMKTDMTKGERLEAKCRFVDCIISPSILCFYVPIIIVAIILAILDCSVLWSC